MLNKKSRLMLETLEDRCTPAVLLWRPVGASTAWETAGNWYNSTSSATSTAAPTNDDVVLFDNASGTDCTISSGSGACKNIFADAWSGTLSLQGSSLNVWGKNAPTVQSIWNTGTIISTGTTSSYINLIGGSLKYNSSSINSPKVKDLTIHVNEGGVWSFCDDFATLKASLKVGYKLDNTVSTGKVEIKLLNGAKTVNVATVETITVSSQGTFVLEDTMNLTDSSITSSGTVFVGAGSSLGISNASELSITGGFLKTADTNNATIDGKVSVTNATISVGKAVGQYTTLFITKDLYLGANSAISFDVNAFSNTQSDYISVNDDLDIDNATYLYVYTSGVKAANPHLHTFISCGGTKTGAFPSANMQFKGTGMTWTLDTTATTVYLKDPVRAAPKIKGKAFNDADADGTENTGDSDLSGVTVYLYDIYNSLLATTTTDSYGAYEFSDITGFDAGAEYYVKFYKSMSNYAITTANVGDDDTIDSDVTTDSSTSSYIQGTTALFLVDGEVDNISVGVVTHTYEGPGGGAGEG